ncbi:hypothetical protein [Pseudomonas nunensis]|uniref:hypothetical protein n=1 Tax=Pseudomonas nunensis TaxID=2961896 RepID=UPI0025B21293|nr:hypothetical protein [Pseudomonas nunensis]MDN3224586.1 hypothetical protein [Pseudomonas nunensis]
MAVPGLELLSAIPLAIVAAVMSAAIALTGVLISNRSNDRRLKMQLKHDAAEKTKERTGKLRQEVYLAAAEELTKANTNLGLLAFKDPGSSTEDSNLSGLMSSAMKCQLVGEKDTALLVMELADAYAKLTVYSVEKLTPVRFCSVSINVEDEWCKKADEQADEILKDISILYDQGKQEGEAISKLLDRLSACQERAEKHRDEREKQYDRRDQLMAEFIHELEQRIEPLNSLYLKAINAIRKDLGVDSKPPNS